MSYEIFKKCKIGTVKELSVVNGVMKFVKSGNHLWLVEYAVTNSNSSLFTRFTTVLVQIEAFSLYNTYSK